ncbi:MAG: AmmeMemoRadiSam system radical SAM enzyme [Candidatus Eisenbacteria bacterium]
MDRRGFITTVGCAAATGSLWTRLLGGSASAQDAVDFALPAGDRQLGIAPALHYEKVADNRVVCRLCPRECCVSESERGFCRVRENRGGEYFTLVHNRASTMHVDPIEKKPLFHVLPGSSALSLATAGCNLRCRFCQNWEISQSRPEDLDSVAATPETLLQAAHLHEAPVIAYTYAEPTIFYEYMFDIARFTSRQGIRNVVISNGYIQERPLRELAPHLTAYKVDLKSFTGAFYQEQCDAMLEPVLGTLRTLREIGLWTEIVTLVIPTLNDDDDDNRAMFDWILLHLGPDVPLHLTRFHPTYQIRNLPRTPVATLERLHGLAKAAGLHYVYLGNVPGHVAESTYCPGCGKRVVERFGYLVTAVQIAGGRCPSCGREIPGVWS